ncbi:exosortase-dependent surface protein XDP1 [Paraglaciecola chathamensis]|uniref:PEP-CTERM protein-sorting domain-containing protein n=1 Tax=Paraglaciecola agarilytica NO2 TaxID=1125747 RepID=A0ABQ0I966_9ALTE|nr:exosortase-dependent surface protein XDP1 [Paraglaciecola agarilytica]GAC05861.1 hypothetical protein GAGA_3027 [Paraglaciecola agarilytica NO2]
MKKLLILRSAALAASLVTMSFASLATDYTVWDFTTSGTKYGSGNYDGNQLSFSSSDNALSVNAWADTGSSNTIETATAAQNSWGLLNLNRDENYNEHYVDNGYDSDMLLLSFDDFVSITKIDLGSAPYDSDISIAAFDSLPTLEGQTWSEVASSDSAIFSASFFDIGTRWASLTSQTSGIDSKYWVIGAYNGAFGSPGYTSSNDFLKIAGIKTIPGVGPDPKPPTDVAEPSSLAVLASFGLFAAWRRRKSA